MQISLLQYFLWTTTILHQIQLPQKPEIREGKELEKRELFIKMAVLYVAEKAKAIYTNYHCTEKQAMFKYLREELLIEDNWTLRDR